MRWDLDDRAVHFWRCRLRCSNPLDREAAMVSALLERQETLIKQAQAMAAEIEAIALQLGGIGMAVAQDWLLAAPNYGSGCTPAWPWLWTGSSWDLHPDYYQFSKRILQTYTAYPPANARAGAHGAWGLFTSALLAPPILMVRYFADGFSASYEDVHGQDVEIRLKALLREEPAEARTAGRTEWSPL